MILVSCRGQEMLIQGPTPNPKCKLNISSFLTHSHSLDCLLCAKDIMVIVLLLHMMGGGGDGKVRGVVHLCYGLSGRTGGGYHISHIFVLLLIVLS